MRVDRRRFFVLSSGVLAAAPLVRAVGRLEPGLSEAQAPAWKPLFTDVRRNVGVFTARGGTIGWLLNADGVVAIDTQYPDSAKACVDGLRAKAGGRQIDLVINTHHHIDHTGGNAVFRAGARRIVAQAGVPALQRTVAAATTGADTPVVADATFEHTWSDRVGDERVTASYDGPGHTGADAVVHFERAHVVHMGDLLWLERHPRIDRPAGASIANWITILEKTAKAYPGDTIFVAGHAKDGVPVTADRAAVLRFRDYFDAVMTLARREIGRGQSRDAVIATTTLPGFEAFQTSGAALSLAGALGAAFDELTARPR